MDKPVTDVSSHVTPQQRDCHKQEVGEQNPQLLIKPPGFALLGRQRSVCPSAPGQRSGFECSGTPTGGQVSEGTSGVFFVRVNNRFIPPAVRRETDRRCRDANQNLALHLHSVTGLPSSITSFHLTVES